MAHVQFTFCPITGECPVLLTDKAQNVYRLWRIVRGGPFPGTYTIMQYHKPRKGSKPVKEWSRLSCRDFNAMLHTLLYGLEQLAA